MGVEADPAETTEHQVLVVLDRLDEAGVRWWVVGGWGVDALVGRRTRAHRDLDLLVDARDEAVCLAALAQLGYRVETDWRPVRVEVGAPGRGWVDVHPVAFDADGHGTQAAPRGDVYAYPPEVFTTGTLGGRRVGCVTADLQRQAHEGYALRPQDRHDLEQLRSLRKA